MHASGNVLSRHDGASYRNGCKCLGSVSRNCGPCGFIRGRKAIEIRERQVNEDRQTHLTDDLASAYMNNALALEQQENFDEALSLYDKSVQARMFCVEELNMFWVMPDLLEVLRYRLMTLLDLGRWTHAANDVLQLRSLFADYVNSERIDDGLKEAADEQFAEMISTLQALDPDKRELLFAELGAEAEAVQSLLED